MDYYVSSLTVPLQFMLCCFCPCFSVPPRCPLLWSSVTLSRLRSLCVSFTLSSVPAFYLISPEGWRSIERKGQTLYCLEQEGYSFPFCNLHLCSNISVGNKVIIMNFTWGNWSLLSRVFFYSSHCLGKG